MNQPELLNVTTSAQLMKLIIVEDATETFAEGCKTSGRIYDFVASRGLCITIKSEINITRVNFRDNIYYKCFNITHFPLTVRLSSLIPYLYLKTSHVRDANG